MPDQPDSITVSDLISETIALKELFADKERQLRSLLSRAYVDAPDDVIAQRAVMDLESQLGYVTTAIESLRQTATNLNIWELLVQSQSDPNFIEKWLNGTTTSETHDA